MDTEAVTIPAVAAQPSVGVVGHEVGTVTEAVVAEYIPRNRVVARDRGACIAVETDHAVVPVRAFNAALDPIKMVIAQCHVAGAGGEEKALSSVRGGPAPIAVQIVNRGCG